VDLGVVVGVDVDETGRHERAVGLEDAPRARARATADLDDSISVDPDVAGPRRRAAAIDDPAAANQEIDHQVPSRAGLASPPSIG
jgi:hypothetical protein